MRIHELAKEWELPAKEVLARLERIGIRGKKAQSSLSEDELARVRSEMGLAQKATVTIGTERVVAERVITERDEAVEQLVTSREQTVEARIRPNVIRRRTTRVEVLKREEFPVEPAPAPVQPLEVAEAPRADETVPPPAEIPHEPPRVETAFAVAPEPPGVSEPPPAPAEAIAPSPAAPAPPPRVMPPPPPMLDAGMQPVKVLGRIDLRKAEPPAAPAGAAAAAPGAPAPKTGDGTAPATEEGEAGRKRKKRKVIKKQDQFETLERDYRPGRMPKKRRALPGKEQRKTEITVPRASKRVVRISEVVTVGDLAKAMGIKAGDVVKKLMDMGMMVTINHVLDSDTAALVGAEFDYNVENVAFDAESVLDTTSEAAAGELLPRPPVVTIMGHVDHGKTSLLDAVRETNVTAGEAGGITQHIGAYSVDVNGKRVTFLDTPGHEAFTAMRARGAKVTDIVVLVVAADDGVMPQTVEAINHARAAQVPIIVAINKIDKPEANLDRVRQELANHGLVPEDWGGETIFVPVSARTKHGIPQVLEMLLLQADVLELRADRTHLARGAIIEAKLDRGRGPVATVLVQEGVLKVGDAFVCGTQYGRVRAMIDDHGQKLTEAPPSTPVEILGLTGVPDAGDSLVVVADEAKARQVAEHRRAKEREAEMAKTAKVSLDDLYQQIQAGNVKELRVVLKADVHGSVEALAEALRRLSTDEVRLSALHASVGGITESDVLLASASNAIVIGFNVRPEVKAADLASREGVDIRLYNIIYEAVNDVRDALEGMLEPTLRERTLGRAEVRQAFTISGLGTIAGCTVLDGKITRGARIRLVRDHVVVYDGRVTSLRRFKDDVREVASGFECGIGLENYQDLKPGDVLEAYETEQVARRLQRTAGAQAGAESR